MDTAHTATILTLPTELLSKILYHALQPGSKTSKYRVAACLAPVCRRFYGIVIWHLYSRCYVQLLCHWSDCIPSYLAKFRGFGDESRAGYKIAQRRFESYKAHGKNVKVLTISTELQYIGDINFPYLCPVNHDPPTFVSPFTSAFPNLKTLTINDRINNPIPPEYILGSLGNILTALPCLKNLNLHFQIYHTHSDKTKDFIMSQKFLDEQQTPPPGTAKLQALTVDVHLRPQVYESSPTGVWLLAALPPLLQYSFNTLNTLSFTATGPYDPPEDTVPAFSNLSISAPARGKLGPLNPLNRKLLLSNLRYLKFSVLRDSQKVLTEFVGGDSFENVEEIEVRDVADMRFDKLTSFITTRFPRLKVLHLKRLDVGWETIKWQFIRDIKRGLYTLKTITAYTKSSRSQIEDDLGAEFVGNMRKLVHEWSGFNSTSATWRVVFEF
ncbi:hypothetical protein TWF281_002807 [Arthrobotrys megalospora]